MLPASLLSHGAFGDQQDPQKVNTWIIRQKPLLQVDHVPEDVHVFNNDCQREHVPYLGAHHKNYALIRRMSFEMQQIMRWNYNG